MAAAFTCWKSPALSGTICDDSTRASANRKGARLATWIEDLRPRIPNIAYHGCRGWTVAKGVALSNRSKALRLFAMALLNRCYRPRLAIIVFLQIFLSDVQYRRIADFAIGWLYWWKGHTLPPATALEPTSDAAC